MNYSPSRGLSRLSFPLLIGCLLSSCKEQSTPSTSAAARALDLPPSTTSSPQPTDIAPRLYYTVELTDVGRNQAQVIAELLNYKPDMLHSNAKKSLCHLPYVLAERAVDTDAQALKQRFESVGASITLQPLPPL